MIEPLETVAVNIIATERKSLAEIGPVQQVATTLVKDVSAGPSSPLRPLPPAPSLVQKELINKVLRPYHSA